MPKDKNLSHQHVMEAACREFLKHGFEGASIRNIGKSAGMSSAGLYRHGKNKEALFEELVAPAAEGVNRWIAGHKSRMYYYIENQIPDTESPSDFWGESELDLVRTVGASQRDGMKLLLTAAAGTKYEHFMADFVLLQQQETRKVLERMEELGYPVKKISERELHMLINAYNSAMFEPIVQDYSEQELEHCLRTIEEFFIPGWRSIMGLNKES